MSSLHICICESCLLFISYCRVSLIPQSRDCLFNLLYGKKSKNKILVISLKNGFAEAGNVTLFTARFFREAFKPPYELKEFIRQCYIIGYKSKFKKE